MRLYKLTEAGGTTRNGTAWRRGTERELPPCENPRLCTADVFHAYPDKNLAFLFNPIHRKFQSPWVWSAAGEVVVSDGLKVGCFRLKTIRRLRPPSWVGSDYEVQTRIIFARLCAKKGHPLAATAAGAWAADAAAWAIDARVAAKAAVAAEAEAVGAWAEAVAAWAAAVAAKSGEAAGTVIDFAALARQAVREARKEARGRNERD